MSEPLLMRRGVMLTGAANALFAYGEAAEKALSEIPFGSTVAIKIVRDRSLPQHRLFWALLDHVAKASAFENGERLLIALKMRLGRYDLMKMPNGKVVPVPQSISFGAMSDDDFQRFFDESVRLICAEVIPGTNSDDLIREVETMMRPQEKRA